MTKIKSFSEMSLLMYWDPLNLPWPRNPIEITSEVLVGSFSDARILLYLILFEMNRPMVRA